MADLMKRGLRTQELFERSAQNAIEKMKYHGAPEEEIEDARLQLEGGRCPDCGKEYQPFQTKKDVRDRRSKKMERIADFTWYRPGCSCLATKAERKVFTEELQRRLSWAGIPQKYRSVTFDTWDRSVSEGANNVHRRAKELMTSGEFFDSMGVVIMGPPGRGKTHIGVSMLRWVIQSTQKECVFEAVSGLVSKIIKDKSDDGYIEDLLAADVVMLDDLDKLYTANEWIRERVFALIDGIYSRKKKAIITTNMVTLEDMQEKFGGAIVSRLTESSSFVKFDDGDDYRKIARLRELRKNKGQEAKGDADGKA